MPEPSRPEDTKPIANAASLFDTDEVRPIHAPPVASTAAGASKASDGYDLEADPFPAIDDPPRPVVLPEPVERPKAPPKPKPRAAQAPDPELTGSSEFATEAAEVYPVWTRNAEWGPDLVRVAIAGLVTLVLLYFGSFNFLLFLMILGLGGAATVLLAYPLLITLERPVRITPEQAVTDFFAAASHHVPHYRRMWLLLSSAGRASGPFRDFDDFRDHWKGRIEGWRASRGASKFAPLEFEVEDFQADKSTGKSTSKADYTVRILLRDQPDAGPVASFRMNHGLVKGPDRMWYLNRGVLPTGPG
jgi:hypothetical protein